MLDRLVRRLLRVMTAPVSTSPGRQALRGLFLHGVVGAFMLLPIGLNAGWMTGIVIAVLALVACGTGGFAGAFFGVRPAKAAAARDAVQQRS